MALSRDLVQKVAVNLCGTPELAERAGVKPDTVNQWRMRYRDFPEPLVRLRAGPVYYWPDIQAWIKQTGR